ncbi:MAG: hypothetical protein RJB01_1530 [Actinomycetota bacterium]|jgi:hypothetical protein
MERSKEEILGAVDALVAQANQDPALRARLIADPKATIKAETGMEVPNDWDLVAVAKDDGISFDFANGELPADYLELVAGGSISSQTYSTCVDIPRT